MSAMVSVRTGPAAGADEATAQPVTSTLDFSTPPPGMAGLRRFTLDALDDAGFLFAMRSTEEPGVRLFVVAPQPYFPEYAPDLDGSTRETLGLTGEEPVLLVVVHPGHDGDAPTANLLAPVAVNPRTGSALQVVLDGDQWPLRAPFTVSGSAA